MRRRIKTGIGAAPTTAPVATAAIVGSGLTGAAVVSIVTGVAVGVILHDALDALRKAVGIRWPWELGR